MDSTPLVSIQIVTWNSKRYIFDCLESIMEQTFTDFSVMVIDNGSSDGTVEFVRSNYPNVSVLQNFKNLGFAKANNQGIHLAKSPYVLVMNPDVILAQDFLATILSFADKYPKGGSFAGKIFKLKSEAIDSHDEYGLREAIKSDIIDSTGLVIRKNRQVFDRGEGTKDTGQFNRAEEIFGVTGACALYRQEALDDIAINNEFFDQHFFAYKEDVDLAWRLRLYGWEAWYDPMSTCYHHRGFSGEGKQARKVINHRRQVSKILRALSFRNHHLMLIKNDQWLNIFLTLPWFLTWEMGLIFYAFIFEPFQYRSMLDVFKLLPAMIIKRKVIKAHTKIQPRDIRKWFL